MSDDIALPPGARLDLRLGLLWMMTMAVVV